MSENEHVVRILSDLESVNEGLLDLFEDIKHAIGARNSSRTENTERLGAYSGKLDAFQKLSSEISTLIQEYMHVEMDQAATLELTSPISNERIVQKLDGYKPHTLEENFNGTKPLGFILHGHAVRGIQSWVRMYQSLCQYLYTLHPEKFALLPQNPEFNSNLNTRFSHTSAGLRVPLRISMNLYANGHGESNQNRDKMRHLLDYLGIPWSDLKIYLQPGRDVGR
ncbi:MAG: hypothetical protein OJF49_002004 [Ktedonobacterales bacterium]|nr:MAG: hypothetical protein OJF49_002004 [Ktedonobacterales bacterium]